MDDDGYENENRAEKIRLNRLRDWDNDDDDENDSRDWQETTFNYPDDDDDDLEWDNYPNRDEIPNVKKDAAGMKRAYTEDVKDLLREFLKTNVNKNDGKFSENLIERIRLTANQKGEIIKIIVWEKDGLRFSTNKNFKSKIDEFNDLIEKAKEERSGTAMGFAEEFINVPVDENVSRSVVNDSLEELNEEISDRSDKIITQLTGQEIREFRGLLGINLPTLEEEEEGITVETKINFVKEEEKYWKNKANEVEDDPQKSKLYETVADVAKLKADELRLRAYLKPESKTTQSIVEEKAKNNDPARFERFKKWAKENLGGISVIAISIAGIITTIVMGARTVIKKGASATSKFAKTLAKIAEKAGPVLGALLNLATGLLKLGAKAVSFLAENLWILVLMITYTLWNERGKNH